MTPRIRGKYRVIGFQIVIAGQHPNFRANLIDDRFVCFSDEVEYGRRYRAARMECVASNNMYFAPEALIAFAASMVASS